MALTDGTQYPAAFRKSRPAKTVDGSAVCLVVAGLENVRDPKVRSDSLNGVRESTRVGFRLDNARSGYEK